jgi:5-methylcytosine-specific restriction protein A
MTERKDIYDSLKLKMEEVGFLFEKEQKPYLQNRKETELKFIHPQLIKKLEEDGYKVKAKKYYLKPLSDDLDSEIGFVTGKSSPLYSTSIFSNPNSTDSFDKTLAWTNREGDKSLDNLLMSIKDYLNTPNNFNGKNTNSFLFAWNPNKWEWTDLQESIDHLENVGYVERRWSCGNSKSIKKGDRVFLIRLSEEPRGIMGSGFAKSSFYVAPHWDGTEGKTSNYIDIEFDILINPSKDVLFDKTFLDNIDPKNVQQWFPQQSGISIKPEVIDVLESKWFDFITKNKYIRNSFVSNDVLTDIKETFREGKSKDIIQTRYERNPEARKRCFTHFGFSCNVCNFNFENHFGEVGKGFIHVHHINQISEIGREYEIDPIKDLIPVCPNCHSMIHSKRPAFTIDEIIEIRKNYL